MKFKIICYDNETGNIAQTIYTDASNREDAIKQALLKFDNDYSDWVVKECSKIVEIEASVQLIFKGVMGDHRRTFGHVDTLPVPHGLTACQAIAQNWDMGDILTYKILKIKTRKL